MTTTLWLEFVVTKYDLTSKLTKKVEHLTSSLLDNSVKGFVSKANLSSWPLRCMCMKILTVASFTLSL